MSERLRLLFSSWCLIWQARPSTTMMPSTCAFEKRSRVPGSACDCASVNAVMGESKPLAIARLLRRPPPRLPATDKARVDAHLPTSSAGCRAHYTKGEGVRAVDDAEEGSFSANQSPRHSHRARYRVQPPYCRRDCVVCNGTWMADALMPWGGER